MLYVEPQAGPAPILQVIQQAHRSVDLNVYYLSSRPVIHALAHAVGRGVRVRVILDEHPYGMKPWQIRKEADAVQAIGARLHWAPAPAPPRSSRSRPRVPQTPPLLSRMRAS